MGLEARSCFIAARTKSLLIVKLTSIRLCSLQQQLDENLQSSIAHRLSLRQQRPCNEVQQGCSVGSFVRTHTCYRRGWG